MVIDIVSKMAIPRWARHVYLAILMCAYFAILKFRDFARILYFESLQFRVVDSGRILEVGTLQKVGKNRGRGEHVQIHTNLHDFFTCLQEVPFNTTFYKSPIVILSVNHEYNLQVKGSRLPENNIISSWVEVGLNFYSNLRKKPAFHATPPLVFPQNDVWWTTIAKIVYWWCVNWACRASDWLIRKLPLRHDQSGTVSWSGKCKVIIMGFLHSFHRRLFNQ